MASTATALPPSVASRDLRVTTPTSRPRWLPSAPVLEALGVFTVFAAVYFVVGYRVVVDQHVVNFDALARLAHAYFVWWNDPQKLAAIGFVWPPVQTVVLLPFALVKPLATSLAALPAASATFMAATILVLNRTLALTQMRWFARYPLLAAFGLNPMILYYGTNGMAEAVYLFFLVGGVYFLLRWHLTRQAHLLAFVGIALALALLSRYEMLPFALVIAAAIVLIVVTDRARRGSSQEIEASLVLFLAPIAYAGAAWLFFNWLIPGDPLYFLTFGVTGSDVSASLQAPELPTTDLSAAGLAAYLVKLNLALFPLTVLVTPVLLVTAFVRRNAMALALAALVATNAIVTALLYLQGHDSNLLQLRYNMRAMPIALIGAGWLYYVWRPRWARVGIWVATMAVLLVSLPTTWKTMATYTYQCQESVFLRALETGEDEEGNTGVAGCPIGIADERGMADYISGHVGKGNVILTDDAQTLGVMLLTGHPERFFDRIDKGEGPWMDALSRPFGRVDYLLVTTYKRCRVESSCHDLARDRYPGILEDAVPGMRVVFSTPGYALVKVAQQAPAGVAAR